MFHHEKRVSGSLQAFQDGQKRLAIRRMQTGRLACNSQGGNVFPQQGAGLPGLALGHQALFTPGKQGVKALHRIRGKGGRGAGI